MESQDSIDNKYIIIERKGHGATADVYLVKEPVTQKIYAAKVLKEPSNYFDAEVEILKSLKKINNPYIVNLIESGKGTIIRANKPSQINQYLVLEYAPKSDLFSYVYFTHKGFIEQYSKVLFAKILKGVQACHQAGICHRDLKMQNILVDENYNPKICDFGFATFNKGNLIESLGTLNYAAPEILLHRPYDGFKADIFSLGVVLLNLVTCKYGFGGASKTDPYYRLIMTKHYELYWKCVEKEIKGVTEEFKKLYYKMVSFKPQERPSIDDILKDDWMKEIKDLNNEELAALETKIIEEFLEREKTVNEGLKKEMEKEGSDGIDISANRSGGNEDKEYFDLSLKPKYAQTGLGMDNYIKIKGNLSPANFMNSLANKINEDLGDQCKIDADKKILKFNVTFEEEEKEEEKIQLSEELEKEIEEDLAKLGIEDNEGEDDDDDIRKKECILQVKIFESINGGYLLRFVKKSGQLDSYYQNLEKVINLVKEIL
jgi:serine/threonine protein kinase